MIQTTEASQTCQAEQTSSTDDLRPHAHGAYLVFKLRGQFYALSVDYVRELLARKGRTIHAIPGANRVHTGVFRLRDQVLPVVDLRALFGWESMDEQNQEFIRTLDERERDHINWLNELEACVREGREFTLATDPHKCNFGRWYDALMADPQKLAELTHGDMALNRLLRAFDSPHKRIHAIAKEVLALVAEGRTDEAFKIIQKSRDRDLADLRRLFAEARDAIHPLLVVVEHHDRKVALQVDEIERVIDVEQLKRVEGQEACTEMVSEFVQGPDGEALIGLLDAAALFQRIEQVLVHTASELPQPPVDPQL